MRLTKDIVGGLLFASVGGFALYASWGYDVGTTLRMGPGYFPRAISGLMLVFGLIQLIQGMRRHHTGEELGRIAWRPLAIITASIAGFALLIEPFGTVIAVSFMVLFSFFADPNRKAKSLPFILAVAIAIPILIFNVGLKMQLKIWGF